MTSTTPETAREQLGAGGPTLTSTHDRWVHALATAGFGLAVGLLVSLQQVYRDTAGETVVYALYALVLIALAVWQTRAARTVPLHSKRIGRWALGATVVLAFAGIAVLGARSGQAEFEGQVGWTEHWWVLALTTLVVAAPMLVAGHLIRTGARS